ncbi:MAG: DUF1513 domain-containing protein [Planctomycetes bacterium]|nr:DUF1513 domain-containing protein [Planctomycetota bacterium]MCW8135648.1 DUF1513 domain-containing protein [Planctomycetota bacterium]
MDNDRRKFLHYAAAITGVSVLAACGDKPANNAGPANTAAPDEPEPTPEIVDTPGKRGMLIGPGSASGETKCWLTFIALDHVEEYATGKRKVDRLPIAFPGHAVVPHPTQPHLAAVFQKWGPGACEVDLVERKVTRPITTVPERMFYGHGAWSSDGKLLYAVESTDPKLGPYEGSVVVRDAGNLRIMAEFPTYGMQPHDCHLLDDGRTLGITNGGGPPGGNEPGCVTFVDIQTQALLEKVTIPELMAGHLMTSGRSSKGDLAVGCTPHSPPGTGPEGFKTVPGGLALRAAGSKDLKLMRQPATVTGKMLGETLSLAIHERRGIAGATNPAGNIATFWKVATGELIKSFELPVARGIGLTLDNTHFLVSYGMDASLVMIRASDLELVPATRLTGDNKSYVTGSHFITYDL